MVDGSCLMVVVVVMDEGGCPTSVVAEAAELNKWVGGRGQQLHCRPCRGSKWERCGV